MTPTVHTKPRVRQWPAGMSLDEIRGRLGKMRDYNSSMVRQGTPQHCSAPEFVLARLNEVGADHKLLSIVFPPTKP